VKIASIEFTEPCSLAKPTLRTTVLLSDSHEFELLENGWLRWRIKGGVWHRSPPEMIRNVEEAVEDMKAEVSHQSQDLALMQDQKPQVRRGKKA
jgi:hypothetical protein